MARLSVRIPDDDHAALEAEATATGRCVSDVVRARLARQTPSSPFQGEAGGLRTQRITVYVNAEEGAHIAATAGQRGMTDSGFLRGLGLSHRLPPALNVFADIRHELQRQGNNLNQLAATANELRLRASFPSAKLVIKALQKTRKEWLAAGDRLDAAMAYIEERFQ